MKNYLNILPIALALSLAGLASCNENEEAQDINGLVADAGADQSVELSATVTLDGSESFDENDGSFSYSWIFTSRPAQSVCTLATPNSVVTEFTPDKAGVYKLTLTIRQQTFTARDTVTVTVTAENSGPADPATEILPQFIQETTVLKDIFADETPDYIATTDVHVSADLTIEPGVKIVFAPNIGLNIHGDGSLKAVGESEKKILLIGTEPANNYWKGIFIGSNSDKNELKHAEVRGGGSSYFPTMPGVRANVILEGDYFSGSAVKLSHTRLTHSGGYGLFVGGKSYLNEFKTLIFEENAQSAAYIPVNQLHMVDLDTEFSQLNGYGGVETSGTLDNGQEVKWSKLNARVLVSGDIIIKSGVVVEPGAYFTMKEGVSIQVIEQGYLNATGTADDKIVFTSTSMNTYWDGILIDSYSILNKIHYSEITHGGLELLPGASQKANIASNYGLISIENSYLGYGKGYGIAVNNKSQINADVVSKNEFFYLASGYAYPSVLHYPDMPSLAGEWVDEWSFTNELFTVDQSIYDVTTGVWFNGSSDPWQEGAEGGYGLSIAEDGTYVMTAAINTTNNGCVSYNAEYMKGIAVFNDEKVTFTMTYWRSKFVNDCDPTQNVDTGVQTFTYDLPYEITKVYNMWTGEASWKLTFTSLDGSTFSYYRKS